MGEQEIKNKFNSSENLSATFYCLLAVCTCFYESVIDKEKKVYHRFLRSMLPEALKIVKNNLSNMELVYLGLKVLWKAVHYEIPLEVKV